MLKRKHWPTVENKKAKKIFTLLLCTTTVHRSTSLSKSVLTPSDYSLEFFICWPATHYVEQISVQSVGIKVGTNMLNQHWRHTVKRERQRRHKPDKFRVL